MRMPFVAGNWKMNKNVHKARELASIMIPQFGDLKSVEKVLCPP